MKLTTPANTARTTAPTEAAVLFDDANLYVAFVSEHQPSQGEERQDVVSLFLDSSGNDKELFQISVSSVGMTSCAWYRSALPAKPLDDGTPNFAHSTSLNLNVAVADLRCVVLQTERDQRPVWTTVMGVPLKSLPPPLWATPGEGQHWKLNLIRTVTTLRGGRRSDMLQSNLSPVFMDAQPVSPYRLANLAFEPQKSNP